MNVVHVNTLPISAPRYTDVAFPPYRFVPGRHPHPAASPLGHSYRPPGTPEPRVTFYPPEEWFKSPDYLYGCDLYNSAYWWEAHEAWEGLWKITPHGSTQRHFLQGLIQVSAAHLHVFQGGGPGLARLRVTSFEHLNHALSKINTRIYMGMELVTWMSAVNDYFVRCTCLPTASHQPEAYPYILLKQQT